MAFESFFKVDALSVITIKYFCLFQSANQYIVKLSILDDELALTVSCVCVLSFQTDTLVI